MKLEELKANINEKANEEVQAKIKKFEEVVYRALQELFGNQRFDNYVDRPRSWSDKYLSVLSVMVTDNAWPAELWRKREAEMMEEILSTMDALQKLALLDSKRDKSKDVKPAVEKATKK